MWNDCRNCEYVWMEMPVGQLVHKYTHTRFCVYHKIGWFKKIMLKICFGLKYEKIK